tara:strand:+ start:60 stop:416 length:357 start_codon:yes stop_codon:yes gene_type:complete
MNKRKLETCLKCPSQWKWGGTFFIIVYAMVGICFGTSIVMDFRHSLNKKNNISKKSNNDPNRSLLHTKEEVLSSLLIFLGFIFLLIYQFLNKSKSGLVVVFPLIILSGYILLFRVNNP